MKNVRKLMNDYDDVCTRLTSLNRAQHWLSAEHSGDVRVTLYDNGHAFFLKREYLQKAVDKEVVEKTAIADELRELLDHLDLLAVNLVIGENRE